MNPFAVLGMGSVCASWLYSRIELGVIESSSLETLDPATADRLIAFLKLANAAILGLSPVVMLVKWLFAAGILYWLLVLVRDDVRFRSVLSVTAHCWIVTLLGEYMNVVILHLKRLFAGGLPGDPNVVLGLDILLGESDGIVLGTFFENITVFSIWYTCLMILGLSIVAGVSKRQAAFAVVFLWLLATGWKAMFAILETKTPAWGA